MLYRLLALLQPEQEDDTLDVMTSELETRYRKIERIRSRAFTPIMFQTSR